MLGSQNSQQVYTASAEISIPSKDSKQAQSGCATTILATVSAYPNCIFIVVNETGAIGSIIRGTVDIPIEATNNYEQEDLDPDNYEPKQGKPNKNKQYIYETKVLLGSTQIEFYELVMRRLLQLIFEQNQMRIEYNGEKSKVFLNIALLKAQSQALAASHGLYYDNIIEKLRELLAQVV